MDKDFNTFIIWSLFLLVIIFIILRFIYINTLQTRECYAMNKIPLSTKLNSVNPSDPNCSYTLKDYYIKSVYNACSPSGFSNNYVSMCALKSAVKGGFRCLDFEIYSINNQPCVATSSMPDVINEKETFNYIKFIDVLQYLNDHAFNSSTTSNNNDPLIIHLRIKSKNTDMLDNLAAQFAIYTNRFLGPSYSYVNNDKNIGDVYLTDLCGKIILAVARNNDEVDTYPKLKEYINIQSLSLYMRLLQYQSNVAFTQNMNELIEFNKRNMTLCFPDTYNIIPKLKVANEMGVQMTCFSLGQSLDESTAFFEKGGYAFILKPSDLRYIPVVIPTPTPQKPQLSFAPRNIQSKYYSFNI